MLSGPLVGGIGKDDDAHDVIGTGRSLAEAAGVPVVFAHVAEVELAPHTSMVPAGVGAGWAPFPTGGFHTAENRALDQGRDFLSGLGIADEEARVCVGTPTSALQAVAAEVDAEAIVVGGRPGNPLKAAAMASVPRWLTVNGDRPVIFARGESCLGDRPGPVVCGIDPSEEQDRAVARVAGRFAASLARPLVLVHVGNFGVGEDDVHGYEDLLEGNRREALRRMHRAMEDLPETLDVELVLESGWEPRQLMARADTRAAPLIVVGSRGRGPLRSALVGSVSLELSNSAAQMVMVVPPGSARGAGSAR